MPPSSDPAVDTTVVVVQARRSSIKSQEIVTINDYPEDLGLGYLLNQNVLKSTDVVTGDLMETIETAGLPSAELHTSWFYALAGRINPRCPSIWRPAPSTAARCRRRTGRSFA